MIVTGTHTSATTPSRNPGIVPPWLQPVVPVKPATTMSTNGLGAASFPPVPHPEGGAHVPLPFPVVD